MTAPMKSSSPQSPILGSIPLSTIHNRDASRSHGHLVDDKPCVTTSPSPPASFATTANPICKLCSPLHPQTPLHTPRDSTAKASLANVEDELQKAEKEISRLNAELTMSSFSWIAIQEACPEVSQVLRLPPDDFLNLVEAQRARFANGKHGFDTAKKLTDVHQNLLERSPISSIRGSSVVVEDGSVCQEDEDMMDILQDNPYVAPVGEPIEKSTTTITGTSPKECVKPGTSRSSSPPSQSLETETQEAPQVSDSHKESMAVPYSKLMELYQTQQTVLSKIREDVEVVINSEESIRAKNMELKAKNSELQKQISILAMCRNDIEKVLSAEERKTAESVKLRGMNEALERKVQMLLEHIGTGKE